MLHKPNVKAFIALVHAKTSKQQEEVQNTPAWPCELAQNELQFSVKFVEVNYKNCDELVSNAINTTTKQDKTVRLNQVHSTLFVNAAIG